MIWHPAKNPAVLHAWRDDQALRSMCGDAFRRNVCAEPDSDARRCSLCERRLALETREQPVAPSSRSWRRNQPLRASQLDLLRWLEEHGPATAAEIAMALGVSLAVAYTRLERLHLRGLVVKPPRGGRWRRREDDER